MSGVRPAHRCHVQVPAVGDAIEGAVDVAVRDATEGDGEDVVVVKETADSERLGVFPLCLSVS